MIISKDLKSEKRTVSESTEKITHLMGNVKLLQNDKESDGSGCDILSIDNRYIS